MKIRIFETNSVLKAVNANKTRSAILAALVVLTAVGSTLAFYHPSSIAYLSSSQEKWAALGLGVFTVGTAVWVFKPAFQASSDESIEVDTMHLEDAADPKSKISQQAQDLIQYVKAVSKGERGVKEVSEEERAFQAKYFQTVDRLSQAGIGDYNYKSITDNGQKTPFVKLCVKGLEEPLILRESKSEKGRYHIVYVNETSYRESPMTFTRPQLSAMMRGYQQPPPGFRASLDTGQIYAATGIVVLKELATERYFLFNDSGALQEVKDCTAFLLFCNPYLQKLRR